MKEWMKNVRKVTPYTPGEQPKVKDIIKLNTNENPYPPSPEVLRAIGDFSVDRLRLYPDPTVSKLNSAIAKYHGVDEAQVFTGVGSDDVLAMCFMTFFNGQDKILFPDITYSFYDVWANLFGIKFERPALDENFEIVPEDYMRPNDGIVIPNPNAPTGVDAGVEKLEAIVKANPDSVVIIDEAYVDFGAESMLPLVEKYDNLIVTRTYSKSRSLAGSRIGYAIASKEMIGLLNDVKQSYNSYTMDSLTIEVGVASVLDDKYFKDRIADLVKTREDAKVWLKELGFTFPDSKSNFIFAKHEKKDAKELFDGLKEKGIFVRYFPGGRTKDYLRISIGTDKEMLCLKEALVSLLD